MKNKEFRQRGISEYLKIIWRQKLAILLPTLAVGLAVGYVVYTKLPSVYQSQALLKIDPPSISEKVIESLTDEGVAQRLNSITEDVKSRGSLEPLILKFDLYPTERAANAPMESLVAKMNKNIVVETVKSDDDQKTTNFKIFFRDREPEKARAVVAELVSLFIKEQQQTSIQSSTATSEFFDKQLAEVKLKLDNIDRQRLSYMMQNADKLPSSTQGLIAQLEGLRGQEKTLETEIGRMRDNRGYIEREKNNLRTFAEKESQQQQLILNDVRRNPAYLEMVKRRNDLKAQLENLLTQFRPIHPDVIAKKNEITQVEKTIAELEQQSKNSSDELVKSSLSSTELRLKNYENEQVRIDGEIERQSKVLAESRIAITDIQRRIESVPTAEITLDAFTREYQTEKQRYDELLKKKNDADLQSDRERNSQGERISIVDGANTPEFPVAPKREQLLGLGIATGLGIGLLLAFLFEFPHFLTINTLDDAEHYTNLPVLAAVPPLLTVREVRWQRGVGFLKIMAGLTATAVSIPLLIIALQAARVFERFVS